MPSTDPRRAAPPFFTFVAGRPSISPPMWRQRSRRPRLSSTVSTVAFLLRGSVVGIVVGCCRAFLPTLSLPFAQRPRTAKFRPSGARDLSARFRRAVLIGAADGAANGDAVGAGGATASAEIRASAAAATEEGGDGDYSAMTSLPRHPSNERANEILDGTEQTLRNLQKISLSLQGIDDKDGEGEIHNDGVCFSEEVEEDLDDITDMDVEQESVYANSYVDLGKVDTIGFDYDYTLVTYTTEILKLIYDMALKRLVEEKQYPSEMLESNLKFDPYFSIRGLAVDRDNGWICHLSYTHKVAVAWEGRHRVPRSRLMAEYTGKRSLSPAARRKRIKPLNDLFSMAECCLMADTVQFFLDQNIPFCPRSAVNDVLGSITNTHISGEFHKAVARDPGRYFEPKPCKYLKGVLDSMKKSGKKLILVSNSPFWYVNAGMKYACGPDWRDQWDVVIASAGKPAFYTEDARPFREVSTKTGRVKFKQVVELEKGEVYTAGCLKVLTKTIGWYKPPDTSHVEANDMNDTNSPLTSPNVMYVGDSLFADLVDAKREFGWTTAAVTPEVGWEIERQRKTESVVTEKAIEIILNALRMYQRSLGTGIRSVEDLAVMDAMETKVSMWRDEQTRLLGNPFGSVFRARYQPSLFAHSLRRYCDLYMSDVGSLRHYSPQHRFYPESPKLLSHEIRGGNPECWDFDEPLPGMESWGSDLGNC